MQERISYRPASVFALSHLNTVFTSIALKHRLKMDLKMPRRSFDFAHGLLPDKSSSSSGNSDTCSGDDEPVVFNAKLFEDPPFSTWDESVQKCYEVGKDLISLKLQLEAIREQFLVAAEEALQKKKKLKKLRKKKAAIQSPDDVELPSLEELLMQYKAWRSHQKRRELRSIKRQFCLMFSTRLRFYEWDDEQCKPIEENFGLFKQFVITMTTIDV